MPAPKLRLKAGPLQGALEQLQRLADTNPTVRAEFDSLFAGPTDACAIAASVIVGNEIIVTLTASDRFLEFLAARQPSTVEL